MPRTFALITTAFLLLGFASEVAECSKKSGSKGWRKAAKSKKSESQDPWCDLCSDNWLFVLGAGGRTGSTTALFMFRQVPGFELAGEHFGLLEYQKEMLDVLPRLTDKRFQSHAFEHKPIDESRILCGVQDMVKALVLGKRDRLEAAPLVLGFKEIRYAKPEMLRFLGKVFPCARFVFTYRSDENAPVHAASFKRENRSLHDTWHRTRTVVELMHQHFNETTRMLAVEDSTAADYNDALSELLGVKGCKFESILHENQNGGYSRGKPESTIIGDCDTSEVDFALTKGQIVRNQKIWASIFSNKSNQEEL